MTKNKLVAIFSWLLAVHLSAILFFTVFRIIMYAVNSGMAGTDDKLPFLAQALLNGLQFDNFVASYVTFLPLAALSVTALCNRIPKMSIRACNLFFVIVYSILFAVSIADIPYFSYFFTHISFAAFGWFEFGGDTAGLLFRDANNYPYIGLTVVSIAAFALTVRYLGKKLLQVKTKNMSRRDYRYSIPLAFLAICLCFTGMRGSFQRYPLRVDYAFFSNNSFFNRLGVNPAFFLLKSGSLKKNNNVNSLMTEEDAIAAVQKELNITPCDKNFPLKRQSSDSVQTSKRPNVVIMLLESMSAKYLDCKSQTSYLHDLISQSYYFKNFYSAGIHTNNGIVSTLYGFPTLFDKSSMSSSPDLYDGLPVNLKKNGYRTFFFLGGNPGYDHMNVFLYENGFDRIYSQYDYPSEKIVNNFGVQDNFLLEFAFSRLNEAAKDDSPFFATVLTVSNHPPYVIPEEYKDKGDTEDKRILAFVDNSLKTFMENAARQDWYQNTIFVFLGDHGRIFGTNKYDMPLDYNHIPLILHSPLFDGAPKCFSQFGGQIDVFPTLMGLLNIPFVNNTPGVDLLKDKPRPCMFFVNDSQLGCIDDSCLYVRNLTTDADILYDLHADTVENIMQREPAKGESLKHYAVSMMITSDCLIKNSKTRIP